MAGAPRSGKQRVGDVTLVLTVFAGLTLIGSLLFAFDAAEGHGKVLWTFLLQSSGQSLYPGFAAACTFNWMDNERKSIADWSLTVVLAVCALCVIGGIVTGNARPDDTSDGYAASVYFQHAAALTLAFGGLSLVKGVIPWQINSSQSDDDRGMDQ